MYCPVCATNNLEGARFCRSCGSDISLVPQALSGHLPQEQSIATEEDSRHRRGRGTPSLDKAIRNIFSGIGFLIIAIVLSFLPMGRAWWFWMLIPAFAMLGGGVADWVRIKQTQPRSLPTGAPPPALSAPSPQQQRAGEFPARNTAELVMPPPSVTEGTTRLLDDEAPTRHIRRTVENPASKSLDES